MQFYFKTLKILIILSSSFINLIKCIYFTPLDLVSLPQSYGFLASPSGDKVIYGTTTYSPETDKEVNNVYLLSVHDKKTEEISLFLEDNIFPVTFLDENRLAFISHLNGSPNLWSVDIIKGKDTLIQHTNFTFKNVDIPKIQNGKFFFTTSVSIRNEKYGFSSGMSYDQLFVRQWDEWYDGQRSHLYVADLKMDGVTNEAKDLFESHPIFETPIRPDRRPSDYHISPDNKHVAFVTLPNTKNTSSKTTTDLYLMNIEDEPKFTLISKPGLGAIFSPKFSPDGNYLAWVQLISPIDESDKGLIYLYNLKTKAIDILNENWDALIRQFEFSKDGKSLLITLPEDGHYKLYSFEIKTRAPNSLTNTGAAYLLSEHENHLLITINSAISPDEIYKLNKDNGDLTQLSNINTRAIKPYHFQPFQPFYFLGALNESVQGFQILPPNFNISLKYPVLLVIHGGPSDILSDSWTRFVNLQIPASIGWVVIGINFHGSYGWGTNFTNSVIKNWGTLPYQDIMLGLDYALSRYSYLDKERIVAAGASYGGYMVNYLNGKTNRFKALISYNGIFNLEHTSYTTDQLYFFDAEFGIDSIQRKRLFDLFSPHHFINQWNTPTLVVHGAKDYRISEGEGIATFTALQKRKIPSRLLFFSDEVHLILGSSNVIRSLTEAMHWASKWTNFTVPYPIL